MKGAPLLVLASAAALAAEPAPPVSFEPPPGWSDVSSAARVGGVFLAFRGPESSSFAVARAPAAALDSAAAARACLLRALDGVRAGARLDYRSNGRIETRTFRGGVTARFLRASVDGRARLIVALLDAGGPPVLATLASAAPDAMMGPLFGAVRLGASVAARDGGAARSSDGQLELSLGGGLRSRDLTADERRQGAVLAVQGWGSDAVFLKVEGEDAAPKDQAAIVRATAGDAARAPLGAVSPARLAATPAGPAAVYAWTRIAGTADLRFAAGFLPWQYWGYSVLARGPRADELLVGALAAARQGPSAVAGLVAASPAIELPEPRRRALAAAAAAGALVLLALAWSRGRKNANLPP